MADTSNRPKRKYTRRKKRKYTKRAKTNEGLVHIAIPLEIIMQALLKRIKK